MAVVALRRRFAEDTGFFGIHRLAEGLAAAVKGSAGDHRASEVGRDESGKKESAQRGALAAHLFPHRQDLDESLLFGAEVEFRKLIGIRGAIAVYGNHVMSGRHIAIERSVG